MRFAAALLADAVLACVCRSSSRHRAVEEQRRGAEQRHREFVVFRAHVGQRFFWARAPNPCVRARKVLAFAQCVCVDADCVGPQGSPATQDNKRRSKPSLSSAVFSIPLHYSRASPPTRNAPWDRRASRVKCCSEVFSFESIPVVIRPRPNNKAPSPSWLLQAPPVLALHWFSQMILAQQPELRTGGVSRRDLGAACQTGGRRRHAFCAVCGL